MAQNIIPVFQLTRKNAAAVKNKCRLVVLCLATAGLAAAPAFCAAPARRPSVVLVILDSVRADRTSPYGYRRSPTPALGALAARGFVYENAYANGNWTGSSFASILTGRLPFFHGLVGRYDALPEDNRTIQSVLAGSGYETAGFFNGLTGDEYYGLTRGFGNVFPARAGTPFSDQVSAAINWEKTLPPEKDFFILLHGNDAHYPYNYGSTGPVKTDKFPELTWEFIKYYNGFPAEMLSRYDHSKWKEAVSLRGDPVFLSAVSDAYDQGVAREDEGLASLLRGIEAGNERPLLVIVTADHGELLGEHGLLGHSRNYFEQLVRVPLLIRFPGAAAPRRIGDMAAHVDLLPTICAATGAACPGGLDGRDLAVHGKAAPRPRKWAAAGGLWDTRRRVILAAAFAERGMKIMKGTSSPEWALYDLAADPGEKRDISRDRPEKFLKLASGYLTFSGAGGLLAGPAPEVKGGDCFLRGPSEPVAASSAAARCQALRMVVALAPADRADDAMKKLQESNCLPAHPVNDWETLRPPADKTAGPPAGSGPAYVFSARPGLWKMTSGGFSAVYGAAAGLLCENEKGETVTDPRCLPAAAALLNCVENYRFSGKEKKEKAEELIRNLSEALKKAGYAP